MKADCTTSTAKPSWPPSGLHGPWTITDPKHPGFYLACWKSNGEIRVSELWYDAAGGWNTQRAYLQPLPESFYCTPVTDVGGWMPMPMPPADIVR